MNGLMLAHQCGADVAVASFEALQQCVGCWRSRLVWRCDVTH